MYSGLPLSLKTRLPNVPSCKSLSWRLHGFLILWCYKWIESIRIDFPPASCLSSWNQGANICCRITKGDLFPLKTPAFLRPSWGHTAAGLVQDGDGYNTSPGVLQSQEETSVNTCCRCGAPENTLSDQSHEIGELVDAFWSNSCLLFPLGVTLPCSMCNLPTLACFRRFNVIYSSCIRGYFGGSAPWWRHVVQRWVARGRKLAELELNWAQVVLLS